MHPVAKQVHSVKKLLPPGIKYSCPAIKQGCPVVRERGGFYKVRKNREMAVSGQG